MKVSYVVMIDESGGCNDVSNLRWVMKVVTIKMLLMLGSHLLGRNFVAWSQFLPAIPISFVSGDVHITCPTPPTPTPKKIALRP